MKWRLVTSIWRGRGPVATRMPFFSPKFKSAANFSAPAQEGNLIFLSGRSARKKIHNLCIKLSHLSRTSRHVWLSSSACDHSCPYQLICIMAISTYMTGASTRFFTVQECSWRVISALATVVSVLVVIMQISWWAQQWSQALDES